MLQPQSFDFSAGNPMIPPPAFPPQSSMFRPSTPPPQQHDALPILVELVKAEANAHLSPQQLEHLAQEAHVCVLAPGEILFQEGEASDAVYLITAGEVEIIQAGDHPPHLISRMYGEFVGEMGVVDNQPRSATARACNEVQMLRFSKDAFLALVNTAPFLVWKLVRNFSARLRQREQEYMIKLQQRNAELAEAAARLQEMNNALEQLVAERTRELAEANGRLEALSITDELTGIYNRRFLQKLLERKAESIIHTPRPFAVIMIDVDHFKHYNDRHGHLAGDEVLRAASEVLRHGIRGSDILARYGGEEFCIVLENARKVDALGIAEKLRRAILEYPFPNAECQPLGAITVSLGVATFPEDATEVLAVLKAADHALYDAKNGGRNRVMAY